ncbi:NAD(P)H-binding protein [Nonlabens sp.]|jgi:nucleoside-diphosphate-sugar epimerase|uniref:NAD(P)H-binding protein n=1 Tax=Nonlabens sp. TaxID=1888209 RepID=UPI003F69A850
MQSKETIGILGCGWLGYDLALKLKEQNYQVRGTSRNSEKLQNLQENEIKAFEIDITENKIYGDLQGFLEHLDALVIDIPPGLRKNPESDFAYRIRMLMRFVQVYEIPHVIFISSTSVFEDRKDIPEYVENSLPNAISNNGKKIIAAEEGIRKMAQKSTIIRPCGLIGEDRHPIKMLAGKSGIKNPDAPVNLVTRDHVNSLITKVITGEIDAPVIHGISEPHEIRKVYYQKAAEEFGLKIPVFEKEGNNLGKKIISMISIS